jgi:(E)-4-hydroxy-3-methylbut-2-enyl-diphosphate synthase
LEGLPAPRRRTRQVTIGRVAVGGGAPVSVQSMCTSKTADVDATLQQIAALAAAGCDVVRVALPDPDDVAALPRVVRASPLPVVADVHFNWKFALAALEAGVHGLRVNPGNLYPPHRIRDIAREAAARGVPIRIGVNAGSLEKDLLERYKEPVAEALVESALRQAALLEDLGFTAIKISVKHHDPLETIRAYRLLAARTDYPLHLGVTEAGPPPRGLVKSIAALAILLGEGIGDTIRVSLTADPVEEVVAGRTLLEALGLRERGFEFVSCPSCGRAEVDIIALAKEAEARLSRLGLPLRVAVMGCIVNGPGEAREADVGLSAGKGKGQIFVKGRPVRVVPEEKMVDALVEEALKLAARGGT